ncbi:hypothetical protein NECAME_05631 [Necator americanus]|uniref:Uncharacterized protein n=1 Tax=Necator americanus TaxID=51031 RepID=W2SHZ6_NECAM|nr:hypothetical protein NECAME_05631 [Necator americanus]ETN68357.1 hypothetical protein NECAME_05631 [Necator americanus]
MDFLPYDEKNALNNRKVAERGKYREMKKIARLFEIGSDKRSPTKHDQRLTNVRNVRQDLWAKYTNT